MHKLTHVEAQRMMAVLGEALEKFSIISNLPTAPSDDLAEALYDSNLHDVANAVEVQWQLEESHRLIQSQANRKARKQGVKTANPKTPAAVDLQMQLHVSSRNLCRILRESEEACEQLRRHAMQSRSPSVDFCLQSLNDLKDLTFRKLSTTVEDETAKKTLVLEVSKKEEDAEERRASLQAQLDATRRTKEVEISDLDNLLSKLRAELLHIKQSTSQQDSTLEHETQARLKAAKEAHLAQKKALEEEDSKLVEQHAENCVSHREKEAALRKKKLKVETEVQTWVEQYDFTMRDKWLEMDTIQKKYKEEKAKLAQLQEHFEKMDARQVVIQAEKQKIAEERARLAAIEEMKFLAAARIQGLFRGVRDRAAVKKLKSKKGKKGKKGKGKKKK